MSKIILQVLYLSTLVNCAVWPTDRNGNALPGAIRTFYVDPQQLWHNRELFRLGRKGLNSAIKTMRGYSDEALKDQVIYTVTAKSNGRIAPSNDKHDFYSLSRYYWPSQDSNSTLYARRDGISNPEIYTIPDSTYFKVVKDDVFRLSLTYFFTGDENYAMKAVQLLRYWYIDPTTRVNPNMNYASWVTGTDPGILQGVGNGVLVAGGILDMSNIYMILDGIGILRGSPSFSEKDYASIVEWFAIYLEWVKSSARGMNEITRLNNLGVWFDVHEATILLFLGLDQEAGIVQNRSLSRLNSQMAPDGSFPQETNRVNSWFYSLYNLRAHFTQGTLSKSTSINYFSHQTPNGLSLRDALEFLIPYGLSGGVNWPFQMNGTFDDKHLIQLCKDAFVSYKNPRYIQVANEMEVKFGKSGSTLNMLWAPYGAYDLSSSSFMIMYPLSIFYMALIFVFLML